MADKNQKRSKKEYTKVRSNGPLYTLDSVSTYDWKLFMWFASLGTIENCIHLFIVVWNAVFVRGNAELTKEFNEETDEMIRIVGEINGSKLSYSKILDNYRKYRHSSSNQDQEARDDLVEGVWMKLESAGLKDYSFEVESQLKRCSPFQKQDLRKMILARMKSFRSFANLVQESDNQIKEAKKDNHSDKKLKDEKFNSQKAAPDNKSKDDNQVKLLLEENEILKSNIENLKKENAQQQAALGNLTNVSWNDDDPNNTAKLISDIEDLQDVLDDFTMVQGSDYKINDEKAVNLLKFHQCQVDYPNTKANLVLGAIFRRCAFNTILEESRRYLQSTCSDPDIILEKNIVNTTESLIKYMKLFGDNREGKDDITKITPIKIRQHAYSALGCRGLPSKHPLIEEIALKLLSEMNRFREVVDEETRNDLRDQAIQITCKVINIFRFRLKTQASVPGFRFFQAGDDVDTRLMQGAFSGQDAKNLEVEFCGFPCIAIFDSDNSNPKVLTKAQVIARPKRSKSGDSNKSGDKSGDDKGDDKGGDKSADKGGDKSADKGGDKSADKGGDKSADKGGADKDEDKSVDKGDDKIANKSADKKSVNAKMAKNQNRNIRK